MVHPNEEYGRQVLEMVASLQSAMTLAGGSVLTVDTLRKMTAEELILLLAPNGVRFIYERNRSRAQIDEIIETLEGNFDVQTILGLLEGVNRSIVSGRLSQLCEEGKIVLAMNGYGGNHIYKKA